MISLNSEWQGLLAAYKQDHQHPKNQACHTIGIPLILASFPALLFAPFTLKALPVAAALFGVGWVFQFIGHAFEANAPSFVGDKRNLLVGIIWWSQKAGLPLFSSPEST